jgi:hypothetical protein
VASAYLVQFEETPASFMKEPETAAHLIFQCSYSLNAFGGAYKIGLACWITTPTDGPALPRFKIGGALSCRGQHEATEGVIFLDLVLRP